MAMLATVVTNLHQVDKIVPAVQDLGRRHVVKYSHGPFFNRSTARTDPGYQIDLVFDRADKTLSLCEIKFSDAPVSVAVGREFQTKLQMFDPGRTRRIESVLISAAGVTQ